jgi:hypothetical protein
MTTIEIDYEVKARSTVTLAKAADDVTDNDVFEAMYAQVVLLEGQEFGDITAQRLVSDDAS